jgi:hypothetical protein
VKTGGIEKQHIAHIGDIFAGFHSVKYWRDIKEVNISQISAIFLLGFTA